MVDGPIFGSITPPPRRPVGRRLAASSGVHALILAVLVAIPLLTPGVVAPPESAIFFQFVPPPPTPREMAPPPKEIEPPPPRPEQVQPPQLKTLEAGPPPVEQAERFTPPEPVRAEEPAPPKATPKRADFDAAPTSAPARPRAELRTNVFAAGASEAAAGDPEVRPEAVRAGFGAPDAEERKGIVIPAGSVARLGAFDVFPEPGRADGTDDRTDGRAVVRAGAFGTALATTSGSNGTTQGTVRQAGFGGTAAQARPRQRAKAEAPPEVPIEITQKPRPEYTDEARSLRLEGNVVLEVVFGASGRLSVLRVVKGLGHGLDESAIEAAKQILFKPARRDGKPVDFRTTVQIVFQLAY